jgi:hypothetical protein
MRNCIKAVSALVRAETYRKAGCEIVTGRVDAIA